MTHKFIATLLVLLLVANYYLLFATPTLAHTLKSDGSIGAVIHIDPEDDPIIGQPANFFFEFKDKENKFVAKECSCEVTITKAGQEFFSEQLNTSDKNPSLSSSSLSFTFPEKGVYQIKVTGNSINAGSFPLFELTYDLRVERKSGNDSNQSFLERNLHLFILGGILIIFLVVMISDKLKRTKP